MKLFPSVPVQYRFPDRSLYPELDGYSRDEIYRDTFGGGALFLAAAMARTMQLKPGEVVLDLGSGKGASSVFLAKHYGITVIALDLWTPAEYVNEKITREGYRDRVVPLNMDVAGRLPFAEGYFDAIFCQNSFNFYGGEPGFLPHLLKHLKQGGLFCIGMETLAAEFSPEERENPPAVYNYFLPGTDINVWDGDFSKMHSPGWWEELLKSSNLLEVLECKELEEAVILYEDLVRYQIEHETDLDDVEISIQQLEYGRTHPQYKTLFTLTARKL